MNSEREKNIYRRLAIVTGVLAAALFLLAWLTEERPDGEWISEIEHKLVVMEPGQSLDRWKDQRVFDCIRCWLSAGEN